MIIGERLMAESEEVRVENGTDVLLALLFAGGARKKENEEIVGDTRLDKLMFLVEKETSLKKYLTGFEFDAYKFGPYSSQLFDTVQALANAGLVGIEKSESEEYLNEADRFQIEQQVGENTASPNNAAIYFLTAEGRTVASQLFHSLNVSEQMELTTIKTRFNSISLTKLLQYIYRKYPESATQSLIREEIC
jgi:uncharacterized protein YwgA